MWCCACAFSPASGGPVSRSLGRPNILLVQFLGVKNQGIGWWPNNKHQIGQSQGGMWRSKNGFNPPASQFASIVCAQKGTRVQVSFFSFLLMSSHVCSKTSVCSKNIGVFFCVTYVCSKHKFLKLWFLSCMFNKNIVSVCSKHKHETYFCICSKHKNFWCPFISVQNITFWKFFLLFNVIHELLKKIFWSIYPVTQNLFYSCFCVNRNIKNNCKIGTLSKCTKSTPVPRKKNTQNIQQPQRYKIL